MNLLKTRGSYEPMVTRGVAIQSHKVIIFQTEGQLALVGEVQVVPKSILLFV